MFSIYALKVGMCVAVKNAVILIQSPWALAADFEPRCKPRLSTIYTNDPCCTTLSIGRIWSDLSAATLELKTETTF